MEAILGAQSPQRCLSITEQSAVAAARRAGTDLAKANGLDEVAAGRVANVIMEAGTNIVKYGRDGEILLRALNWGEVAGVEVIALDRGPGIADMAVSMHDGTSASGTYGLGLGAMQRMADGFDIYSSPDKGTAIWMSIWADEKVMPALTWDVGVICQPIPGETKPGDSWGVCVDAGTATVLVADGLGHGLQAAAASEAAAEVLARRHDLAPAALMHDMHAALHGTRGAAVAIARLDCASEQAVFAGIGNIAACLVSGDERRQLVSHNGIVGSNMRKVQEFIAPWPDDATLIMHSDGLGSRWDLRQYAGLHACHPALIAAVLYRDFARRRDDVTVLALRTSRMH